MIKSKTSIKSTRSGNTAASTRRAARRSKMALRLEKLECRQLLAADTGLGGVVFDDVNQNGQQDVGESPIADVAVYLDTNDNSVRDALEPTTFTDASGRYAFEDLEAGSYIVRQELVTGVEQTSPASGEDFLFAFDQTTTPQQILRLDSTTGAVVAQITSPVQLNASFIGMAFDGSSLFLADAQTDTVYEVDSTTGDLIDSDLINKDIDGAAFLGGKLYLSNPFGNRIFEFDPQTDQITRQIVVSDGGSGVDLLGGLAAFEDSNQLVVLTGTNRVAFVNPDTGLVENSLYHGGGNDVGAAVVGDNYHLTYQSPGFTGGVIFDRDGGFVDSYTVNNGSSNITVRALAGLQVSVDSHRVSIAQGETVADLDFGRFDRRGEFSGTQFKDQNGDGIRDANEQPLGGVTVYLDQNNNRQLDVGEPTQVTAADGTYTFTEQLPGSYVVRQVEPERFEQTGPNSVEDVLFGSRFGVNPDVIFQIDAQDGSVIRQFASSYNSTIYRNGLAFDGQSLFVVDQNTDAVIELDAQTGAEIDRDSLPAGQYDGVATLNGLVYVSDYATDDIVIFDPVTDTVIGTLDINGLNGGKNIVGGLSAITGPDALIATTGSNDVIFIDPATGLIQSQFAHGGGTDQGVAVLGDEVLISYTSAFTGVVAFTRDGTFKRSFLTNFPYYGFAGQQIADNAHRITLGERDVIGGLDFGNLPLNQIPVPDAGGPYVINEGDQITLDASATTDGENDAIDFLWDLDGDGEYDDAAGVNPIIDAATLASLGIADDGVFVIAVQADDGFDVAIASSTITVANVAPSITSFDLTLGQSDRVSVGESVSLDMTFDDPGQLDTHTVTIDWGDGTQSVVDLASGQRQLTEDHVYADGGRYEVIATVTDDDGGTDQQVAAALVVGIRIANGELQIVGTNERDFVLVHNHGHRHSQNIRVLSNLTPNHPLALYEGVTSIRAWLGDGNDFMKVTSRVDVPAIIDGQGGNDKLAAGRDGSVLLGGSGNDWLFGGAGNDIVIGGTGSDLLFASRGDDILIGGSTIHDQQDIALASLLQQWNSGDDYASRIATIRSAEAALLPDDTVIDDADVDWLFGGRGQDWLFDGDADQLIGVRSSEIVD